MLRKREERRFLDTAQWDIANRACRVSAGVTLSAGTLLVGFAVVRTLWLATEWVSNAGPSLGGWHPLGTPPGVAALAGLGVLTGSANLLYERWGSAAPLIPLLVTAAASMVMAELPTGHGVPQVLPWVAGAALAALVAKMLILHRYARAYLGSVGPGAGQPLLASRKRDLKELDEMVRGAGGHGRVIPVVGRWGEGKSFLLNALQEHWNHADSPTLVAVDVWRLEGERDLQAALIDALLAHPHNRRRLRWVFFPLVLPLSGMIRTVTLGLSRSGVTGKIELELPALNWQRLFEQITGRSPHGTVIALDELDRAVPAVTQAALTLAKRSGAIPGVTILLSYTTDLIRYKAFNPLLPSLPDLASTMEAVLHAELYPALEQESPQIITRALTTGSSTKERRSPWSKVTGSGPLGEVLLGLYAAQSLPVRQRLQARFEEKYLGTTPLTMRRPAPDDLAEIVRILPEPRRQVAWFLRVSPNVVPGPSPRSGAGAAPEVAEFFRVLSMGAGYSQQLVGDYPPIRALAGAICEVLQVARQQVEASDPSEVLSSEMSAMLILVALDLATRTYMYGLPTDARSGSGEGHD